MFAKSLKCRVIETRWATPSVFIVRFRPSRAFHYLPGQFVSVVIPALSGAIKRCYSLASSPEESERHGHYELCVRLVPGGAGSTYLASLKPGDTFRAFAPYGAFTFKPADASRGVVFISTSTGIAPFRSIVASAVFQHNRPKESLVLYGARDEKEILYERDFRELGVATAFALSRPSANWKGFKGRVTDFLKALPADFSWHKTDFYLCGNGDMIQEVSRLLLGGRGVSAAQVHLENFSPMKPAPEPVSNEAEQGEQLMGLPFPVKSVA
jgi:ferredoxin-NADP reductase